MTLKFLHLQTFDILSQLELEEAILKAGSESWCIINEGSPKCIVMGVSNKTSDLLELPKIKEDNIRIIKRFSGGGTVFVDEETLFVSFIFSKNTLPFSFPEEIYSWTDNFYKNIFENPSFSRIENDYVLEDKKCCGNAQYIRKNRWLHHSSFLWNYNPKNMDYLKIPKTSPKYRKNRSHKDFLCSINSGFPSKDKFIQKIKYQLSKNFEIKTASVEEVKDILGKNYNKSTKIL